MNFKKTFLFALAALFYTQVTFAQAFVPAMAGFSKKKNIYIHLENGKVIEGSVKSFKWKKGLIEEIKMDGTKQKIAPEKITHMYIPPSGYAKFASAMNHIYDAQKWQSEDLDKDILEKGYCYLEKSEAQIKKNKSGTYLLQLVNPHMSTKIKVYHDPFAGETASVGVGGVTVAGGIAKSYYAKKAGAKLAIKLEKKNYKDEFKTFFGDCPSVMKKYGDNPKWKDFALHVQEYTNCK